MSFIFDFFKGFFETMIRLLSFGGRTIKNTLSIYIKTNTGSTLNVEIDPKWQIRNVKEIVGPKLGIPPEEVKIIFAGKELHDNISIEECDLGEQSILHAVKTKPIRRKRFSCNNDSLAEANEPGEPLCETLTDFQLSDSDISDPTIAEVDPARSKAHFYVYCSLPCKGLKPGKLRVRCVTCRQGAITVDRDPQSWNDVTSPRQISGLCETPDCPGENEGVQYVEFYFKCAEHPTQGEDDYAVALNLIRSNLREIPCLACSDVSDPVLVFPCEAEHVTCLDCFRTYCETRLRDRQFVFNREFGYTLACPAGCTNSYIQESHHFKLLTNQQYAQYQRFGTEEFVLNSGGVLCPQPDCGMGILADPECIRITCEAGCGFVFCRRCLQGFHIGDCAPEENISADADATARYNVDPARASQARWDAASRVAIKVTTKPCPKCRTATERAGGCMHMVCTRPQCGFHWCWICQTEWTRDCMGAHWFG